MHKGSTWARCLDVWMFVGEDRSRDVNLALLPPSTCITTDSKAVTAIQGSSYQADTMLWYLFAAGTRRTQPQARSQPTPSFPCRTSHSAGALCAAAGWLRAASAT